ncbi:MAG: hypothetical protein L6R39_001534 [Caloplaca ligustica]|nr:MAG: hypothetical protein L6R39_001534 [Caloplaca ligustica]
MSAAMAPMANPPRYHLLTTLVYSALSVGVSAGCQHWAYGGDISTMSGDIRQLRGDFSEIRRSTALLLETVTRMETNLDAKSRTMSTLIESLQAQRYRHPGPTVLEILTSNWGKTDAKLGKMDKKLETAYTTVESLRPQPLLVLDH